MEHSTGPSPANTSQTEAAEIEDIALDRLEALAACTGHLIDTLSEQRVAAIYDELHGEVLAEAKAHSHSMGIGVSEAAEQGRTARRLLPSGGGHAMTDEKALRLVGDEVAALKERLETFAAEHDRTRAANKKWEDAVSALTAQLAGVRAENDKYSRYFVELAGAVEKLMDERAPASPATPTQRLDEIEDRLAPAEAKIIDIRMDTPLDRTRMTREDQLSAAVEKARILRQRLGWPPPDRTT